MLEDLTAQIEDSRKKLDEQEQLRRKLVTAREDLTKEAYRLRTLETELEQVTEDISMRESFCLRSLVESLLGAENL